MSPEQARRLAQHLRGIVEVLDEVAGDGPGPRPPKPVSRRRRVVPPRPAEPVSDIDRAFARRELQRR